MDNQLIELATRLGAALAKLRRRVVTAESCTGGLVSAALTDVAGSSEWFERGYVTYSNRAKREMLGVATDTLEVHGAVSEATVREMAAGALSRSGADLAVAISGVAGPGGGSAQKPVGTVWFAWAQVAGGAGGLRVSARCELLPGGRDAVRRAAVRVALEGLLAVNGEAEHD